MGAEGLSHGFGDLGVQVFADDATDVVLPEDMSSGMHDLAGVLVEKRYGELKLPGSGGKGQRGRYDRGRGWSAPA